MLYALRSRSGCDKALHYYYAMFGISLLALGVYAYLFHKHFDPRLEPYCQKARPKFEVYYRSLS